jgi:hypothetical protein
MPPRCCTGSTRSPRCLWPSGTGRAQDRAAGGIAIWQNLGAFSRLGMAFRPHAVMATAMVPQAP